jgi:hypothetical protein
MGMYYEEPLFPILSMISGFAATGFIIGIISKDVTIAEPGLGSILVAGISYFVITSLDLPGFEILTDTDWLIVLLNSVIFTFIGAWLGEKLQHGDLAAAAADSKIDGGWIVAGALLSVFISLILLNISVMIFGPTPSKFFIPFFIAMLVSGFFNALRSPGKTIIESAIAGIIAFTVLIDIIRVAVAEGDDVPIEIIAGGIAAALIFSYIGGYIGEEVQSMKSKQ